MIEAGDERDHAHQHGGGDDRGSEPAADGDRLGAGMRFQGDA